MRTIGRRRCLRTPRSLPPPPPPRDEPPLACIGMAQKRRMGGVLRGMEWSEGKIVLSPAGGTEWGSKNVKKI